MYRVILGMVVGAIAVALLATGCGGGGSDSLTKAEFIKQGDVICASAENEKNQALEAAFAKQAKLELSLDKAGEEELVTTVALPPVEAMYEELGELGTPDEGAEEVAAIVTAFEEAAAHLRADPGSAISGGEENPFAKPDQMAGEYGFGACAEI